MDYELDETLTVDSQHFALGPLIPLAQHTVAAQSAYAVSCIEAAQAAEAEPRIVAAQVASVELQSDLDTAAYSAEHQAHRRAAVRACTTAAVPSSSDSASTLRSL